MRADQREAVDSAEHRALAIEAAGQSLVLLRNEPPPGAEATRKALPFAPTDRLALIGPHATSTVDLLGNYHGVSVACAPLHRC